MSRKLCRLDDIPDGEGKGFVLDQAEADRLADGVREVFVVRCGGEVYGYVNSCPHTGTPLDWIEDQFMTRDKRHILCATHGAEFEISGGRCVSGPCKGDTLSPVLLTICNDEVHLSPVDRRPCPGVGRTSRQT